MAEGSATFGGSMKTSGKLHQMLNQSDITPQKIFSINNMTGDITQNIQAFLSFCHKKRQFTERMLKISFNSSYQDLQNEEVKKVAQHTIQVLTNDEDALSSFLFSKAQQLKTSQTAQQHTQNSNLQTIQSEAQRLFGGDSPRKIQKAAWQNLPNVFEKFQLVTKTLEHLKQQSKNQTCLGYINKLYSSLLRRQGNLFLQYLKQKPEYLQLLINNLNYISIGNILALTLSCQDKTGQYKHQQLKKQIFRKILDYGFSNITDSYKFEGFITTVEQILSSTKQSYYQYFQDFKRCANILVSQHTLKQFYKYLNKSEQQFGNASIYLQMIIKRINSQTQQQDYYRQNQTSQPTMKFQHYFFFSELDELANFISLSSKYSSMIRVNFLGFVIHLIKNMQKTENSSKIPKDLKYLQIFKKVIINYGGQKVAGLVKNYLFQILKLIAKSFSQNETKQIAQWLLDAKIQQQTLKRIFADTSLQKSNANESSCFILSILFQVQNKYNNFLSQYSQKNKLNLANTLDRYKTKLANYGQEEEALSPSYEDIQLNFKMFSKNKNNFFLKTEDNHQNQNIKQPKIDNQHNKQKQKQKQVQTQTVGKNSVVIPVLNLPQKSQIKVTIEQQIVQPFKLPAEIARQALIRDLKNTRIQIPQKFKQKKTQQVEKKTEQKELKDQKQQKQIKLHFDLQQNLINHQAPKKQLNILQSNKEKESLISPNERKYFIRHITLF